MHPKIFEKFTPVEITTDGKSVFDFLGGKIDVSFKHGWIAPEAGKTFTPGYPPSNEWMADWIAVLLSAHFADDHYAVVELGAGYGQWMTSALQAYRHLKPNGKSEGLALEADTIHFEWLEKHISDNGLNGFSRTIPVYGAAGTDGEVTFPVITDPAKNYGASLSHDVPDGEVSVRSYSLNTILAFLNNEIVDLLHIDIQGAEEELLVESDVASSLSRVKFILVGTHRSNDLHRAVRETLVGAGFTKLIEWPRNSLVEFLETNIHTNDGALLYCNPVLVDHAAVTLELQAG